MKKSIVVLLPVICLISCGRKEVKPVSLAEDYNVLRSARTISVIDDYEGCIYMHGGCVANDRIYYLLCDNKDIYAENVTSRIIEYRLSGTFRRATDFPNYFTGPDMSYVDYKDTVVVADGNWRGGISFIALGDLFRESESWGLPYDFGFRGIEYIGDRQYILASGSTYYVNSDEFTTAYSFECDPSFGEGRKGICAYGDYLFDIRDNKPLSNEQYLLKYNFKTKQYIKKIPIEGVEGEIQWVSQYGDGFYVGTSNPCQVHYLEAYL